MDGFGILEDRLCSTDETFNSLLLLGYFRTEIAFCFFFCRFMSSYMPCHVFLALVIYVPQNICGDAFLYLDV